MWQINCDFDSDIWVFVSMVFAVKRTYSTFGNYIIQVELGSATIFFGTLIW